MECNDKYFSKYKSECGYKIKGDLIADSITITKGKKLHVEGNIICKGFIKSNSNVEASGDIIAYGNIDVKGYLSAAKSIISKGYIKAETLNSSSLIVFQNLLEIEDQTGIYLQENGKIMTWYYFLRDMFNEKIESILSNPNEFLQGRFKKHLEKKREKV